MNTKFVTMTMNFVTWPTQPILIVDLSTDQAVLLLDTKIQLARCIPNIYVAIDVRLFTYLYIRSRDRLTYIRNRNFKFTRDWLHKRMNSFRLFSKMHF